MPDEAGRTAVIVPLPALDPVVGAARHRFDPAAAAGVPAHVTVVYPFLPLAAVSDDVVSALTAIVVAEPAPRVTFARWARFPSVLYLAPEPADVFGRLTRTLVARWPQAPPYGGQYGDDVTPHLTVTLGATDEQVAEVERSLTPSLPVTSTPVEAVLIGFDGRRWTTRHRFPFGPSHSEPPRGDLAAPCNNEGSVGVPPV